MRLLMDTERRGTGSERSDLERGGNPRPKQWIRLFAKTRFVLSAYRVATLFFRRPVPASLPTDLATVPSRRIFLRISWSSAEFNPSRLEVRLHPRKTHSVPRSARRLSLLNFALS